ncbi:reverse transcriptase domain-containing protein, partial [Lentzea aerocolonigenes]
PGRSALDAVAACRQRCWKRDWVIDLDIQKFFDSVPWDLIVTAVEEHADAPWVVLYVKRWLRAPLQHADGRLVQRDRGTPQGSAVSPVLANLFLHYAFDAWMAREFPTVPFERYVDDAVVHCASKAQAETVARAIAQRMEQVGLRLHPDKTKIVYCQDGKRRGSHEHTSFTFLGFTFRQRRARGKNGNFNRFLPAISKDALNKINAEVRSWRLHRRTGHSFADLAGRINPVVRGWMQYYGAFYRSALYQLLSRINAYLMRWIRKKYKRLRAKKKSFQCWWGITQRHPRMFAHWTWVTSVPRVW